MSHWQTPPALDARTTLPLAQRGIRASGHHGAPEACTACLAAAPAPVELAPPPVVPQPRRIARERAKVVVVEPPPPQLLASVTRIHEVCAIPEVAEPRSTPPRPEVVAQALAEAPGASLTVRQKILLAAARVETSEGARIDLSDIVVEAWETWPDTFGLKKYKAKHPNANTVFAKLCGNDGLLGLGWLQRVDSDGGYVLTKKGRAQVKLLRALVGE